MTNERWEQVKEVFDAALRHRPEERAQFLDEVCGDDETVRREVDALLSSFEDAGSFMAKPVFGERADTVTIKNTVLTKGQYLGHYEINEQIGVGGMGVVYRARDTKLNRPVAIKLLSDDLADAAARRRFQREAQMASSLNHPHILTVYDAGEFEGRQYLVTEFIDGGTLDHWVREKERTWREIAELLTGVADGLATAHAAGILHRDVKPGNILVAKNGYAKLVDFGLAKLEDVREFDVTRKSEAPTRSGVVIGTVAYMSPEQASGKSLDTRSDTFSFGVALYGALAGYRPFEGATTLELMHAIIHLSPKPLPSSIPVALRMVVEKALEKDPADRYQSMRDLVVDLRRIARQTHAQVPLRRRRWAWAALLPALVVAGFFAWRAWRAPESTEPLRAVPLTTLPGVAHYPSLSPDGNYVAFTWNGPRQDNPDIYVQQIGVGSPLRLTTDPSNDYNPVWSPDGRWIAFLRRQSEQESELRLIPPLSGPERKLTEIRVRGGHSVTPPYLAWCPESNCLVVTDSPGDRKPDALFVISLESGEKRQLTNPTFPAAGDANPAVSPDGSWLVFRRGSGIYAGELYRLPLGRGLTAAGEPRRLTPPALDVNNPTWMPDSKEILFSARGSLWRLVVVGEKPGESQPARLPFVGEDGLMPVVSRPQPGRPPRLVYVRSFQDNNIWRVQTSALGAMASLPPVTLSFTRHDGMAQLSPDGRRVAFASGRSGEGAIWLADPDGSNAVQLTTVGARATGSPRWSPDGERIVFHSSLEGQPEVYVIPSAGGTPRNLTSNPAADGWPSFSADGQWIYFYSNRTGERQIWKIPASGGDAVQVTNNVGYAAFESADGAYLYYTQTADKPSPLWRLPVSGGLPVKVLEGVVLNNFVVLNGGVYYIDLPSSEAGIYSIDRPAGETRLQYFNFATRKSITVARNLGNVDVGLTASPDGRTILYSRVGSFVNDLMLVENFR